MLLMKKWLWPTLFLLSGLALVCLMYSSPAQAASVYSCSQSGKKCVVRLDQGIVGDQVQVMDEKARTVARGRIIKRKGVYALVSLSKLFKQVKKGYPVMVNLEHESSDLNWASMTPEGKTKRR